MLFCDASYIEINAVFSLESDVFFLISIDCFDELLDLLIWRQIVGCFPDLVEKFQRFCCHPHCKTVDELVVEFGWLSIVKKS